VRKVYQKPFVLGVTTNGVLLDEKKLDYMKANNFGLLLSFDGDKEIQDRHRPMRNGQSSFDAVYPKFPMVLERYPNITFRSTIDHDDRDVLRRIYKFAVELGYNNIFCIPNNLSVWSQEEMDHLVKQLRDLYDYWMDLFRQGIEIDFQPLSRAFNEINRINSQLENNRHRDEMNMPGYGKCGIGGTGFCSVSWEGKLYSCQEMVGNTNSYSDNFHIGDIYNGVNEEKRINMVNSFDVRNVRSEKPGRCETCLLNSICSGYCSLNNVIKSNGDPHILPEVSCVFYETLVKEAERMLHIMAKEKNQLFKKFFLRVSQTQLS
jgi:uncharacterized protein